MDDLWSTTTTYGVMDISVSSSKIKTDMKNRAKN
jgi:hypothetical protein